MVTSEEVEPLSPPHGCQAPKNTLVPTASPMHTHRKSSAPPANNMNRWRLTTLPLHTLDSAQFPGGASNGTRAHQAPHNSPPHRPARVDYRPTPKAHQPGKKV